MDGKVVKWSSGMRFPTQDTANALPGVVAGHNLATGALDSLDSGGRGARDNNFDGMGESIGILRKAEH